MTIFQGFVANSFTLAGRTLWKLGRENGGGASLLVAFAAPIVIGGLGLGVDAASWYQEKKKAQQVADAAALGGARLLGAGQSSSLAQGAAARDAAKNGFVADSTSTIVVNSPPTSGAYAGDKSAVEVIVTKPLPMLFSRLFMGSTARQVVARSVAAMPYVQARNVEVSLVLDSSVSMGGSTEVRGVTKMEAQRSAAKQLITTVVQSSQSQYTSRVALAPFSTTVNAGDYFQQVTNQQLSGHWSGVVERTGSKKFKDDMPSTANGWFGDFKSRRKDALGDYSETVKLSTKQSPGEHNTIRPLANNVANLQGWLDDLETDGTTAGHLGLAWAWYMLSPKWDSIFSGVSAPTAYDSTKTYKAIVIMSDFDFNTYFEAANGDANSQFDALCTQIKAAGIKIYTVGYGVSGSSNNARRTACASNDADATYTYTTTTVDDLVAAFQAIASSTLQGAGDAKLRIVE